jgi:hypothetical protein
VPAQIADDAIKGGRPRSPALPIFGRSPDLTEERTQFDRRRAATSRPCHASNESFDRSGAFELVVAFR